MILTITASTIVISKVVLYFTTFAAASAGVGATVFVQKMNDARNQAEEAAIQQIEDTGRERNERRLDHLDSIVDSTLQQTLRLETETSVHSQKIALNLERLDSGVAVIDSEKDKLMATNTSLLSTSEANNQKMQGLLEELKVKIILLEKASQALELAKSTLLERENEIATTQEQLETAKKSITQLAESLDTVRNENAEKSKKIASLEKDVEKMAEQHSASKESLSRASLKIQDLVKTRKALVAELQASEKLVIELTSQIEAAQRQLPIRAVSGTNPGFFA
ncbi:MULTISPECIES: hypothetical protein [Legionella]|uniref:Uncharacterized protein n=1 Tax=Legionella donaldsonii TaxID=45060 RepID=A0A378J7E7_9GAMM|nr:MULTISPECIES: hypothetical protein [Legionella]MCC5014602.1 hypothetical protein [Legionella sp. 31fI33]STX40450.1 Uncharacterised protein [Legionella donaldsonii]